jgi:hypothetical protein
VERATAAAPSFFAPIEINDTKFRDGATGCNNPVQEVYAAAKQLWSTKGQRSFDENVQCIISIGTGKSVGKAFSDTLLGMNRSIIKIATETESTAQNFARDHKELMEEHRYFRFTVSEGMGDIRLDDHKRMVGIQEMTESYINDPKVMQEFRTCIKQLSRIPSQIGGPGAGKLDNAPKARRISLVGVFVSFFCLWLLVSGVWSGPVPPIDPNAPIFTILGKTGVGKSTFIDLLGARHVKTRRPPVIGHSLSSGRVL